MYNKSFFCKILISVVYIKSSKMVKKIYREFFVGCGFYVWCANLSETPCIRETVPGWCRRYQDAIGEQSTERHAANQTVSARSFILFELRCAASFVPFATSLSPSMVSAFTLLVAPPLCVLSIWVGVSPVRWSGSGRCCNRCITSTGRFVSRTRRYC